MTKRSYTSPLRAAASSATRERIVAAAQNCFEELGFAGTTMRAIATRAGTSLESVNGTGAKRDLLMAAIHRATSQVEIDGQVHHLPEPMSVFDETDPVVALANLTRWIAQANQRISRLWRAFDQAADTDPQVRGDYADYLARMRAESARVVRELGARKALRPDLEEAELADLLWLAALPDQHRRLCVLAGWSQDRYGQWLTWTAMTSLMAPGWVERA